MDETKKAALKQLGFSDADITDLETRAAATQKSADDQGVAYKAEEPAEEETITLNGKTYVLKAADPVVEEKAAPPMAEEEAPAIVEEDAMSPDGEMDGGDGLSLSPEDLQACEEACYRGCLRACQEAMAPLMGVLDLEKKMATHVQNALGGYTAQKDAEKAETKQQIDTIAETVKAQGDQLAELIGDQPEVRLRPSASPDTIINPFLPADQQLLESAKAQQQPAFEFSDLVTNLFGTQPQP